jgi:uncharacterized membrane protein
MSAPSPPSPPEVEAEAAVAAETPPPLTLDQAPAGASAAEPAGAAFDRRVAALAPLYAAAGRSLAWGFRVSMALLAIGLLLSLLQDEPLPEQAEPLPEVLALVRDGEGAGFVDLGIIAIVLTPVATVLVLALGFLKRGDRSYALVTFVVLAILGVSVGISLLR